MKSLSLAALLCCVIYSVSAQRAATKSTKFAYTEVPTIPEDLVRDIQFSVHASPGYFGLDDLRRWGGNAAILKEGERLSGMSYYTLDREVAIVDGSPTLHVQVALGEGSMGRRTPKSEAVKGEEMTHWYLVEFTQPVTVQITDATGELLDGFELPAQVTVRYGNEKISTLDRTEGGFTYSRSKLDFRTELELESASRTPDAERFIRRKAVLTQLSNLVDVLETRLYFNEVKAEVTIASAKNKKVDYTELDLAQEQALLAFSTENWGELNACMVTWNKWLEQADLLNPKASVNKEIARALHLNLAQAYLYLEDFMACARHLQAAKGLTSNVEPEWVQIEALRTLLANRRKGFATNPGWQADPEAPTFKAIDLKDILGKRSENKDVELFTGRDIYDEFTRSLRDWQAIAEADAPEQAAADAAEVTLAQRLGSRLEQTIGGYMLRLNPILDRDLVGKAMPAEILEIDRLVYLDVSGMAFTTLPENLGSMAGLSTLVLSGNALTTLPESVGELGLLKKLMLKDNPLTELPSSLRNCAQLKVLDLRGTQVDSDAVSALQAELPEDCKIRLDE